MMIWRASCETDPTESIQLAEHFRLLSRIEPIGAISTYSVVRIAGWQGVPKHFYRLFQVHL